MSEQITKDLGGITAYAAAVAAGYTGTKAQFETLMASYATVAESAAASASDAASSAAAAASHTAPTYDATKTYNVGEYVVYSSQLYRCITAITTAEAWTTGHWTRVALGDEVADVKEDYNNTLVYKTGIEQGYYAVADGTAGDSANWCRSVGHIENNNIFNVDGSYEIILLAYTDKGVYVGAWNGSTFTTLMSSAIYFKSINIYEMSKAFPSYVFKLVFYLGGAAITPSDVNSHLTVDKPIKPIDVDVETEFDKIEEAYPINNIYEYLAYTHVDGKLIASNGTVTNTSSEYRITDYIDISGYDELYITANSNWSNALYAFYDSSKNVVSVGDIASAGGTRTVITNKKVTVPSGAKYVNVSGSVTSPPAVKAFSQYACGKWNGLKWCCIGDSLTERNIRSTKFYHDYVAEATGITVVNMGVSGTGYAKNISNNTAFFQRAVNVPVDSDVITIFGSFNDNSSGLELGTYLDNDTTTIGGCINATLDAIQTVIPTANIGVVSPTPWQSTQPTDDELSWAYNYVALIERICKHRSIPFLDLWRCSNLRPWDADFREIAYDKDGGAGTHPNEIGHKLIAPHFKALLESLLI